MGLRGHMVLMVLAATVLPVVIALTAVRGVSGGSSCERDAELARVTSWLITRDLIGTRHGFKLARQLFDLPSMKAEELTGVLRMLYKQDEEVDVVVLLDGDDQAVVPPVFLRAEQIENGSRTGRHLPVDESDLAAFLHALPIEEARARGAALSGVYVHRDKNVALVAGAVAVPAGEKHKPWILGFERVLRRVQQTVSAGVTGGHHLMFVVDGGGRLVAHPEGARFLRREPVADHPLVARYLDGHSAGQLSWKDAEGRLLAGAFQRIAPVNWAVVVQRPVAASAGAGWLLQGWAWPAWAAVAVVLLVLVLLMEKRVRRLFGELEQLGRDAERRAAELQRLQASLLESGKLNAIGDLGAGVAHEFNNPLGGILGLTQLLLRKKKEGDPDLNFLQRIEKEARRCKEITDNLLRFSEQQAVEYREPLRIGRLADATLKLLTQKLESQRIKVECRFEDGLPRVMGHEGQLQRAILNVLFNAETAMPAGGTLALSTGREGDWVVLRIVDNGRGIPPENLDRVFEPFFTTKDEWRGAGLGLSVVYQIVKDHGGTVSIDSTPGRGTEVVIRLPREPDDSKEQAASAVPLA